MEKISNKAIREEKIKRLKEKILSEIQCELDNIKTTMMTITELENEFFNHCITTSYMLLGLKEYIDHSESFNTIIKEDPQNDLIVYNIADKYLNIWLQEDYNFIIQFKQHARNYPYDLFSVLNDIFFGFEFTNVFDIMQYEDKFKVNIVPTNETSFGISDTYHIINRKSNKDMHVFVPREKLFDIINENNYIVIDGKEYIEDVSF